MKVLPTLVAFMSLHCYQRQVVDASQGMTKEQTRQVEPGITVRTMSFEKLVKELAEDHQLYRWIKKAMMQRLVENPFPSN